MGYSTRYRLTWKAHGTIKDKPNCIHNPPSSAKFCSECGAPVGCIKLDERIAEYISGNSEMRYVIDPGGRTSDSGKWYDHEKDMVAMSIAFPNVLFHLYGEGEDAGDIWKKWFLNGRIQVSKARIVFDEFSMKNLVLLPQPINK